MSGPDPPIGIVLVDDHCLVRTAMAALLAREADFRVLADTGNGEAALELVAQLSPQVVIMDVGRPDGGGVAAVRGVLAISGGVKVVALALNAERRFVLEMFNAGAAGYLLKDCAVEELARAVRRVHQGKKYLGESITDWLLRDYVEGLTATVNAGEYTLTAREREVLKLLAEGKTTSQIALCLSITVKTVETHTLNIKNKLGLHSLAALTRYALRQGLTALHP